MADQSPTTEAIEVGEKADSQKTATSAACQDSEEKGTEPPKEVDLGGDIHLLVGPKGCQARIRVCRSLLSFASKYFLALFTKFAESSAIEQGEDIKLLGDEPDAVVNLCKILHMRYEHPMPMNSKELLHLAIVADKYDCVKSICLATQALYSHNANKLDFLECRDLVVASYLLDNPRKFAEYTKHMLGHYTTPLFPVGMSEVGQRVPMSVWFLLESRRAYILRILIEAITNVLKRPCTTTFASCTRTSDWYSRMTNNLNSQGLLGINAGTATVQSIKGKLEKLTVPTMNDKLSACSAAGSGDPPAHPVPTTGAQLKKVLEEVAVYYKGSCLDCLNVGENPGTCRSHS